MTQLSWAGPAASNPRPAPSGRRAPSRLARRPELVPVLASALAWVVLVIANGPIGHGHGAEGSHGLFTPNGIGLTAAMTIAMMGPLAVAGVRTTAFTSPWWRAGRAAAEFFAAFGLTWIVIALCLAAFAEAWTGWLASATAGTAVLVAVCALAQLDPGRPDRMTRCDRPMRLRARGTEADVDCVRFGALTAGRDVRFCALSMLAMLALPGNLLVMAFLTALVLADRVTEGRRRLPIAAAYAVIAVVLAL
ncbi:MAG TPA: DUF2182 domain-containing protein [Nakamurella sp.]|nr:DUF2182 domain-containing protein [Nakamurella sp.]